MSALAIFAILCYIAFLAGTLAGIFVTACRVSKREDKAHSAYPGPRPGRRRGQGR